MKLRSLKDLLSLQPPEVEFLIKPQILAVSGSLFIYGEAESLKSWLVLEMAMAMSTGHQWLRFDTSPGTVALLQTEQTELMYRRRVVSFVHSMNGSSPLSTLFIASEPGFRLDDFTGLGVLEQELRQVSPSVIILDNLFMSVASVSDEMGIKRFLRGMSKFQQQGRAVVIVHHTRKEGGDEPKGFQEMAGMSDLNRWADTIVRVTVVGRTPGGRPERVRLDFEKLKNTEEDVMPLELIFNRSTTRFRVAEVID